MTENKEKEIPRNDAGETGIPPKCGCTRCRQQQHQHQAQPRSEEQAHYYALAEKLLQEVLEFGCGNCPGCVAAKAAASSTPKQELRIATQQCLHCGTRNDVFAYFMKDGKASECCFVRPMSYVTHTTGITDPAKAYVEYSNTKELGDFAKILFYI